MLRLERFDQLNTEVENGARKADRVPTMEPVHKRRPWIYLAVGLAAISLLAVSLGWWLGWPERTGPRTVSDRAEVISLGPYLGVGRTRQDATPARSWLATVATAQHGYVVVWKESPQEEDSAVPPAVLHVVVAVAPEGVDLCTLHELSKGMSDGGLGDDVEQITSPVRQWRSLASSSSTDGRSQVVTLLSDTFAVSIYAYADNAASMQEADQVIASLKTNDEG